MAGRVVTAQSHDVLTHRSVTFSQGAQPERKKTAEDGSFEFVVPCPVGGTLIARAVHHRSEFIPIASETQRHIRLNIRLASLEWNDPMESVRVIGEFNDYKTDESAISMTRRHDGAFEAFLTETAEVTRYQVIGPYREAASGRSLAPIAGTDAAGFEFRGPTIDQGAGGFVSVKKRAGNGIRIVFDPRRLPRAREKWVRFEEPGSPASVLAEVAERVDRIRARAGARAAAARKRGDAFTRGPVADAVLAERAPDMHVLAGSYVLVQYFSSGGSDSALLRQLLADVPPHSPLWSISGAPNALVQASTAADAVMRRKLKTYMRAIEEGHPHTGTRIALLLARLAKARQGRNAARAKRLRAKLEAYELHPLHARMLARWDARATHVEPGRTVPDFELRTTADQRVSKRMLAGAPYLIHFWASWCQGCDEQLAKLAILHRQFEDRGFSVISVAMHDSPSAVAETQESIPMPWHNVVVGDGDKAQQLDRTFAIQSLPQWVLVGPDERILQTGSDLSVDELRNTIEQALEGRRQEPPAARGAPPGDASTAGRPSSP